MSSNSTIFHPWLEPEDDELACIDERPKEIRRKGYLLAEGVSCKDWYPENVECQLDEEAGMVLADVIPGPASMRVVSEPLKKLLEHEASCEIEFLPISIRDHRDHLIGENYYIANVLEVIFCMDRDKSDYVESSLDETRVHTHRHLYLDDSKIPENANLFRLGEDPYLLLVRQDLAKTMADAGLTGIEFIKLEDFGKTYR